MSTPLKSKTTGRDIMPIGDITEVSVVAIDFNQMKPEDVFKWLKEFGYHRYPIVYRLEDQTVKDPRYVHERNLNGEREVKGMDATMMIVPSYYFNKTMFLIDQETLDKIKKAFEHAIKNESIDETILRSKEAEE